MLASPVGPRSVACYDGLRNHRLVLHRLAFQRLALHRLAPACKRCPDARPAACLPCTLLREADVAWLTQCARVFHKGASQVYGIAWAPEPVLLNIK